MTDTIRSPYDLPTPCLLIDLDRAKDNIAMMQRRADALGLKLRPHIKTHRMPYFAALQMEAGACGIACAKLGEAEVMAQSGISDIFIANELIGADKYERLRKLHRRVHVRVGIDNTVQLEQMERAFSGEEKPLEVLIEYTYRAESLDDCRAKTRTAWARTVRAADMLRALGAELDTVSVGATPSVLSGEDFAGITELRLGTYVFFDVGQARALGAFERCAATVLASVISKPEGARVVLDAGAKALVSQNRPSSARTARRASAPRRASARSRARRISRSKRSMTSMAY